MTLDDLQNITSILNDLKDDQTIPEKSRDNFEFLAKTFEKSIKSKDTLHEIAEELDELTANPQWPYHARVKLYTAISLVENILREYE